jgi:nickel/cobalt transporter (NiCoT) family protein
LPTLFAAGMSLMDSADGALMSRAYGWAYSSPVRKVYHNITVTSVSFAVALAIGLIELLQVSLG